MTPLNLNSILRPLLCAPIDIYLFSESCKLAQTLKLRGERRLSKPNRQAVAIQQELDRFKVQRTLTYMVATCSDHPHNLSDGRRTAREESKSNLSDSSARRTGAMAVRIIIAFEKNDGQSDALNFPLTPPILFDFGLIGILIHPRLFSRS